MEAQFTQELPLRPLRWIQRVTSAISFDGLV